MTTTRYFSDIAGETREVFACWSMRNTECESRFPGVKARRYDSFSRMVGPLTNSPAGELAPITRVIRYKNRPSLHECNGKCRNGKCGGVCECRCGGRNHGVNNA